MGLFCVDLVTYSKYFTPECTPISGDGSHIRNETKFSKCQKYPDQPLLDCRTAFMLKIDFGLKTQKTQNKNTQHTKYTKTKIKHTISRLQNVT